MTAEIFKFTGITCLDMPPDLILDGAKGKVESVVVMGYTPEGEMYFASSIADGGTVVWLMEQLKNKLITGEYS